MYICLKPKSNTAVLPEVLYKLDKWANNWSMEFNPEKCHVIYITRNKTVIITQMFSCLPPGPDQPLLDSIVYISF